MQAETAFPPICTAPLPAGNPPSGDPHQMRDDGCPPYADDIPSSGNAEETTPPQPQPKRTSKFKKFLLGVKAIIVGAWPHIRDAIYEYGPIVVEFVIELFD